MVSFARLRKMGGFTFLEVQASLILVAMAMGAMAVLLINSSRQTEQSRNMDASFSFVQYTPSAEGNFLLETEISTGTVAARYSATLVAISRTDGTSQSATVMLYPN